MTYKNLILPILSALILAGAIFAWQEPSQAPPEGNVPAPLNVGPQGQAKEGGLILNTGGAETGLIVDKGRVGIGTTLPAYRLDVNGVLRLQPVSIPIEAEGIIYYDSEKSSLRCYENGLWRNCVVSTLVFRQSEKNEMSSSIFIKRTAATYTGDLGGKTGADAKCASEFPGSHFCSVQEKGKRWSDSPSGPWLWQSDKTDFGYGDVLTFGNEMPITDSLSGYSWADDLNDAFYECEDWTSSNATGLFLFSQNIEYKKYGDDLYSLNHIAGTCGDKKDGSGECNWDFAQQCNQPKPLTCCF